MNLLPLVSRLSILTKDLQVVRFTPNWAQQEYLAEAQRQLETDGRIRIVVLKARQLGISTVTEALLFTLCFIIHDYKALVIAHEVPASQNLLAMTSRYWQTAPWNELYTTRYAGKNHLQWQENGSSIGVATAGNKAVGRSATYHGIHASELGFWPAPELAMGGLRQTVPSTPGTCIVLESTANGVGNYLYETWQAAEQGDNEYKPLFFPWHRHPDYLASAVGLPYKNLGKLDDEEKILRGIGLSDDRLAWRRWAIRNLCDRNLLMFHQEYPTTPEEAFISSGSAVFPSGKLAACYEAETGVKGVLLRNGQSVTFQRSENGPLTLFRQPAQDSDHGQYLIGGDPTGTTEGDYAVAQVINRHTMEQVAVWRGKIDAATFAEELFKLGLFFNQAIISPEVEGPGGVTVGTLLGMNYPRIFRRTRVDRTPGKIAGDIYGWSTTAQSKQVAVGFLLKVVVDETLTIHDAKTFSEMKNYVTDGKGGYENGNNEKHDDTVMALAIAIISHAQEAPVMPYGSFGGEPGPGDSLPQRLPWDHARDDDLED